MTHRRLRPLLSGLVLIALTVTACATTITGTGRALPPPAPPNPLLRTDGHTALGDLVTGDLCAGIPLSAFRQWGSASRHGWQSADACYLDIALPDGGEFQLDTWAEDLQSFYPGNSTTTAQSGNASIRAFPQADGDCERALVIGTIAFETHVEKLDELPSGAVQCATTDRYAHLELAALAGRHLTPRSLASPSLTRYDLCALMSSSDMGHVDFLSNSA
ncbi:MAG: hypothetical protein J0H43_08040, partial [Actinobacteria bacterium]|nr:hypothetical protein [Actinomycetota bacterium]